ncbi:cytochrome C oxidase subunit IV family protein [Sulfurovum sp.]|uniref:cytochrome C oxidase subunit IV family protein n=1 Tax=Sulfurovum sp. TaxID=1969726 RepID=UPI002868122E|nr:cytochrome C oxidase subunit IV family protein [Sulfurovum sp.]
MPNLKNTLFLVWFTLVLLTVFAFVLGYLNYINTILVFVLLVSTFLKGQLVIDYFMGLRSVKLRYRLIPTVWLFTMISIISITYYLPI